MLWRMRTQCDRKTESTQSRPRQVPPPVQALAEAPERLVRRSVQAQEISALVEDETVLALAADLIALIVKSQPNS